MTKPTRLDYVGQYLPAPSQNYTLDSTFFEDPIAVQTHASL